MTYIESILGKNPWWEKTGTLLLEQTFQKWSPRDNSVFGCIPRGNADDIENAVNSIRQGLDGEWGPNDSS